jgi:site-specific DNA-methyltransferase (adenine-specific)
MAWTSFDKPAGLFSMSNCMGGKIHPTQKPIALYEWLLSKYAKEGDKILDTHLGSGSIAIACQTLGFELTGCELNESYFESATKRIKAAFQQTTLFDPVQPKQEQVSLC